MDQQDAVRTKDHPISATVESGRLSGTASEEFFDDATSEALQSWASTFVGTVESVIRRYPLSTLLLGIGMGYLLARRAR